MLNLIVEIKLIMNRNFYEFILDLRVVLLNKQISRIFNLKKKLLYVFFENGFKLFLYVILYLCFYLVFIKFNEIIKNG